MLGLGMETCEEGEQFCQSSPPVFRLPDFVTAAAGVFADRVGRGVAAFVSCCPTHAVDDDFLGLLALFFRIGASSEEEDSHLDSLEPVPPKTDSTRRHHNHAGQA